MIRVTAFNGESECRAGGVMPQEAAERPPARTTANRNPCWGAKLPATQLFLPFAWMRVLLVQSFLSCPSRVSSQLLSLCQTPD
jgi:hypothetical protein